MFYSLKSRFQGCLIGAYLGLKLADNEQVEEIFNQIIEIGNKFLLGFIPNKNELALKPNHELALLFLPLILSFHDILNELEIPENLLIWSEIISLICRKKVTPENLIEEILTNHKSSENLLIKQLKIVENFVKTGKSLQELIRELTKQKYLENAELALAIYCFICTPEDVKLSLKRAKIISNAQKQVILGLTGALLGIYNSDQDFSYFWPKKREDDIMIEKIKLLANNLFSQWSGVYQMKHNQQLNLINVTNINLINKLKSIKKAFFIEDFNVTPYIMIADILVGDYSSLIGEFCAFNKPIITFKVSPSKRTIPEILEILANISIQIDHFDQIFDAIKKCIENPNDKFEEREKTNKILFYSLDGKAGFRAAQIINQFLDSSAKV